jgi:AcrR family transcriptional regulator
VGGTVTVEPPAPGAAQGRRRSRRGEEARAALLAAAERLFAEHGIAGVSLRDVSAAAGQRNHSAAQYHFGDRPGLVAAIYRSHMERVDARRTALLDELVAAGTDHDVRALVRAQIVPLAEEVTTSEGWYARFLLRAQFDPLAAEVVVGLGTTTGLVEVGRRLVNALASDAEADLPGPLRRSRLDQLALLVISTLAAWEWAHDRGGRPLPFDDLVDDLTATGTAVLLAPCT